MSFFKWLVERFGRTPTNPYGVYRTETPKKINAEWTVSLPTGQNSCKTSYSICVKCGTIFYCGPTSGRTFRHTRQCQTVADCDRYAREAYEKLPEFKCEHDPYKDRAWVRDISWSGTEVIVTVAKCKDCKKEFLPHVDVFYAESECFHCAGRQTGRLIGFRLHGNLRRAKK